MKSPSFQEKFKSLIFFFNEREDELYGSLIITMGMQCIEEVVYLIRQQVKKKCNEVISC